MTTIKDDIGGLHKDAVIRAIERQRNDALSREAQKDAVIALLQSHAAQMATQVKEKDVKIESLSAKVEALTTALEAAEKRKKPRAA